MNNDLFSKIENKTRVKKDDIIKLAQSVQNTDLSNEDNLRALIKDVAKLAGKDVTSDKEAKIINAIKGNKVPKDLDKLL